MGQVALNCGYHKCQFDNIKAKKGKGEANPRRMAALLVEHLEDVRQTASNKLLSLAMEFHPFKAARAAGLRLDDSSKGGAKGAGKGKGSAEERERSRSRN
ncbi:unnamed protein product [Cladocopium goreaui]|uniref:RNA helicase n=1 Tax=Cladocopium goreaui TaxID=2562237 RepID=A0A9P1D806_9DINO|nr:unnamed protein product [Cladocopium goreaui]